jgi:hypothetical protein
MNPLKTNFDSAKNHACYLEALKLSCLKNIELANQELEAQKWSEQSSQKTSWFELISPKKAKSEAKNLEAYKSNICRQMMISKKINELDSKSNIA